MEALTFLAAPIVMGILLVGIHAYLGLHVLKREVVFVDISLSQVAALGGALSLFFVHDHEDKFLALLFSLGLCLLTALFLAYLKRSVKRVSQEALIGMTYAFASGAMMLVADRLPHGGEHLKEALIGNILFVTWKDVLITALVYAVVGAVHFKFREAFWKSSSGTKMPFKWDFLFYFLFGIIISFSTKHAGVLVVFSILVAPAALAVKTFAEVPKRLMAAWIFGSIGVILSFFLSYAWDLPAGASVVCTLTLLFFVGLGFRSRVEILNT